MRLPRLEKESEQNQGHVSGMDWGPRGTSNFWFDRRDDNERNVMCASQSVNIGDRSHNGFCTDKKDPQLSWQPSPASRGTILCETSVSGICRAPFRLRAQQIRGWRSKNQGMCSVVGYFANIVCTRPVKTDVWRRRGQCWSCK